MHSSRTWLTALSLLLLLAAAVRATVWWAHDPLLAYANNYDQIRTMAVLGVRPDAPGLADLDGGTPEQPWARFKTGLGWRMPFYPSSDTAIRAAVHVGSGLWRPGGSTMDIRQESAWLLAAWLLGVAWIGWRLLSLNAWHGLGFAAWVLLVTDPINLLFLNTWYSEFSAFACVTGLVGLGWLWLAGYRKRWVVGGWMLALLLVLATNRQQYVYLPLALLPLAWLAGRKSPCRRGPAAAAAAVAAVPLLLFSGDFAHVKDNARANRVDTVLGAMLPAASDPASMVRNLRLQPACLQFAGDTWYTQSRAVLEAACPRIMNLPLRRMLFALAADPAALARMVWRATNEGQGFVLSHLGQVQGGRSTQIAELDGVTARSVDELLRALPRPLWRVLALGGLVLPALLAVWAARQRKAGWPTALWALEIAVLYVFFSSLLGDGYVEIHRHAVLCYSLGCLSLMALFGAAMHHAVPAPYPNQPSGFVP